MYLILPLYLLSHQNLYQNWRHNRFLLRLLQRPNHFFHNSRQSFTANTTCLPLSGLVTGIFLSVICHLQYKWWSIYKTFSFFSPFERASLSVSYFLSFIFTPFYPNRFKNPLILFPSRLKCSSSLIKNRTFRSTEDIEIWGSSSASKILQTLRKHLY